MYLDCDFEDLTYFDILIFTGSVPGFILIRLGLVILLGILFVYAIAYTILGYYLVVKPGKAKWF